MRRTRGASAAAPAANVRRRRWARISLQAQRVRRVEEAFASLPDALPGRRARLRRHLPGPARRRRPDLGGAGTRGERCAGAAVPRARARRGDRHRRRPPGSALREGRLSGLDAFAAAPPLRARQPRPRARLRGAVPAPRRPPAAAAGAPTSRLRGATISSLISGDGPEQVICLHGLGSNKTSFFETVAALTPDHTRPRDRPAGLRLLVEAGARRLRRPLLRPRGARLHGRDGDRARAPGRQLDGRPGRDRAGARPRPTASATLSLLCPGAGLPAPARAGPAGAAAAARAGGDPAPAARRAAFASQFWSLFADRERLDPAAADVAADEFCRTYRSRSAPDRLLRRGRATSTSTPRTASGGFWTRLAEPAPAGPVRLGRSTTASSRPPSPAHVADVAARRPPGRARPTAATCPRSSCPSETNGLIREQLESSRAPARRSGPGSVGARRRARRRAARAHRIAAMADQATARRAGEAQRRQAGDGAPADRLLAERDRPGRRRRRRAGRGAAGGIAEAAGTAHPPPPDRRPRRARPRLHPRERCRCCGCSPASGSAARSADLGNIPEEGPVLLVGNHSGGNLTPDTLRLHARLLHLLRRRAALLPARPQPRALAPRPGLSCASTAPSPPRPRTPRRRSRRAPRCSSTRAATGRSTGPTLGAQQGRLRRPQGLHPAGARRTTCRSSRWSRSAARRRRCSSAAASGSRGCCGLDRTAPAQGAADLARRCPGASTSATSSATSRCRRRSRSRCCRRSTCASEFGAEPDVDEVYDHVTARSCRRRSTRSPPSAASR